MNFYKGIVQYKGTDFYGWQVQPGDQKTIQGELNKALKKISKTQDVHTLGSGRTDAGVHAFGQVFKIKMPLKLPAIALLKGLNSLLPDSIRVIDMEVSHEDFHPVFQAKNKEYQYVFSVNSITSPFSGELITNYKKELDIYFYDCLQFNQSTQLRFSQSWLNYNPKGTFHHVHTHPNSIVSGVYFIKGDQQPILFERFENDHLFGNIIPEVDKYNYYNCGSWKVTNKPGYLLLFPSSVKHGVVMNEATEERISLSFNTFVTGTIGKNRGLTELKI